jgi:DNA-binding response OmpR family regulator
VLPLDLGEADVHALIIEDESMIAMAIEDILRDVGFITFDFAPSPAAAIEAASLRCPELITSDVQLNPGCGITTVLTICEKVSIPVIFVTGNIGDVMRRLPGSYALSKPFSVKQLAAAVTEALK